MTIHRDRAATLLDTLPDGRRGRARWPRNLTAAGLGVLAAVAALLGSWIPSLWGDEATSVMSAERSLPSLTGMVAHVDAVHGLYYAGLHVWGSIFGFSPFSVRLPSAIAVGFATAAVVVLVTRLRSLPVAVVAGLVCAVLPRVTYMGEEARSYAFSAAIVAWLTVLLVHLMTGRRNRWWWAAYGGLLTLGIYTFLYTALFILVHGLLLVLSRAPRGTVVRWLCAVAAAAVAATPVILFAYLERGQIAYLGTTDQISARVVFSSLWFGQWQLAAVAWALIGVAIGAAWLRRRSSHRTFSPPGPDSKPGSPAPSLVTIALAWLSVPAAVLISMQLFMPAFTARYLSFCAPAAAILIGCGIADLFAWRRPAGALAAVLVLALVTPIYLAQRTPYAKNDSDWAEVSAAIGARAQSGDAVVFDEATPPYRRPRLAMHTYPAGFRAVRDVTLKTPFTRTATWYDASYSVAQAGRLGRFNGIDRVWLIEYAPTSGSADRYGIADLFELGFRPTASTVRTHLGLITLYERTSA